MGGMGSTAAGPPPHTVIRQAGHNPYAAGPYSGQPAGQYPGQVGPPGYPGPYPQMNGMMTPEQMQAAFLAGMPTQAMMASMGTAMFPPPPPRIEHTTTIRNDVNLKKATLRFISLASDPDRLFLDFQFDCAVPSAVTVFPVAVAEPATPGSAAAAGHNIVSIGRPHSGKRTLFPKGMNLRYSQARNREEFINIREYSLAQLTNVPMAPTGAGSPSTRLLLHPSGYVSATPAEHEALPAHLYPVIVMLEAVAETDPAYTSATSAPVEGVLAPVIHADAFAAAAASSHLRLQLTYATLVHRPGEDKKHAIVPDELPYLPVGCRVSADWVIKNLRQRIQVAGAMYELREIYGIDGGNGGTAATDSSLNDSRPVDAGAAAAEQILASGSECVVCLTERRDTTVLPCRHMCMCFDCANHLRMSTNKCPICRTPVQSLLQIKIGGAKESEDPRERRGSAPTLQVAS